MNSGSSAGLPKSGVAAFDQVVYKREIDHPVGLPEQVVLRDNPVIEVAAVK